MNALTVILRFHRLVALSILGVLATTPAALAGVQIPPGFSINLAPDTIGVGSCTELTFTIQNNMPQPISDLAFTLALPAGVTLTDPANPINECGGSFIAPDGGNMISLTNGTMAAAATCAMRVGVTISAPGPFDLTTSDLTSNAGNSGTATATLGVPVPGPVLGFTKAFAPDLIPLGGRTRLTYTIQNQSAADAVGIAFMDSLPAGLVIADPANPSISCAGGVLTAVPGTQQIAYGSPPPDNALPGGQTCTISLDVVGVTSGYNISVSGDLTASSPGTGRVSSGRACGVLEVIPPEDIANITFTKSFLDNPVAPGGVGTLEFTVTNNSASETFSNIFFTDDLNATLPGLVAVEVPTEGGVIVDASFGGGGVESVLGANWDYLDRIENENGADQSYPDDGDGDEWYSSDFDLATSTIGPWSSGVAPLQGGEINAFPPGTPAVLFGIDAAGNGENLVTTYLFRQEFMLTAAEAATADWLFEYIIDDGAIVYVNGVEVWRTPSMPGGAVTTNTLSGLGDEDAASFSPVDLSGRLAEGANTIAVEVHQTELDSSDVGFFLEMVPATESPTGGFSYADDTFEGTDDPNFSMGSLDPTGGFMDGGLTVVTGGKGFFSFFNPPSSGGWARTFTVNTPGNVSVSLRYRLLFDETYGSDEFSQALFELDGTRYGNGPGNSLAQFTGGGGAELDTGWQVYTLNLFLAAGDHTILLGAYNNKSNRGSELTQVWFDDVQIGTPETPAEVCGAGSQLTGSDLLTFSGGILAPGETCSFRVEVEVPLATPTGSYLNTTSRITTEVSKDTLIGFPASDTLLVEPIPPAFTKVFAPDSIAIDGVSTLTFTIDNRASLLDATALDFVDSLPAGVVIANPPNAATTCVGGTVTAVAGSGVISYSGGAIPAGASCTLTVDVIGTTPGNFANTTGELTSSLGNSGTATDTLIVNPPPSFAKSFAAGSINAGQVTTLTFTIDNSASTIAATAVAFDDNLPAGLVVASPVNFTTTCPVGSAVANPGSGLISYFGGTVPAGGSCTVTFDVTSAEGGAYVNTTGELTSSLGNSGTASDTLEVQAIVSVTLRKDESSALVVAGSGPGNLTYVVTATNNGPSTATGITVNEVLTTPAGVTVDSITPSAGTAFTDPIWDIGSLAAGTSATLTVVLTVDSSAQVGADVISDTATLATVNELNNVEGEVSVTESTSIIRQVDLAVTKMGSADPVIAGSGPGNLTYVVTVANNGPSDATGVMIGEMITVPVGVTVDSITPSAGTNFAGATWTVGNLASGDSATLTLVLTADRTALLGNDVISNTASILSVDQPDLNGQNDSVSVSTSVRNEVDIALTKTDSIDPVLAGSGAGNLVYTVTATNTGPSDASGVRIREALTLPTGVTIDSITPGIGTFLPANDPAGVWALDLPVGEVATLTVTLTVAPEAPNNGTVSNTASLEDVLGVDTDDSNDSATEETGILAGVDLVVTKTESIEVVVAGSGAGNLEYLVTVTNNGPLDATGVELNEMLSFGDGVTIASVTPSAGSYLDPVWTVGSLANGASETLTVVLTVGPSALPGVDAISNTAAVSAVDQPENAPGDDAATVATDVTREVDLVVTVSESRDPVLAGFDVPQNLYHTVVVTNNGPSDASGVTLDLSQDLPAGVTLATVSPAPDTTFSDSTWTIGDLSFSASAAVLLYLTVPAEVSGGVDLIATTGVVSGASEPLINLPDDMAAEATSVVSPGSMVISAGSIDLDLQTALFNQTITITNNNPRSVPAFRVLVNGLPADVSVHNAQGSSGGSSYLLYNQALAAGASIDLVVEYFQLDASGGFTPTFEIELLDAVESEFATEGVELDRCVALPNGDILIEFAATIGGLYTIQYSEDGEDWINVVPDILSGGTRRQWIDNGPPKTPSHPGGEKSRLYRVVQKAAAE